MAQWPCGSVYRTARPQHHHAIGDLSYDEFKFFEHSFRLHLLMLKSIGVQGFGKTEEDLAVLAVPAVCTREAETLRPSVTSRLRRAGILTYLSCPTITVTFEA
jgi:hypothetical protein